MSAHGRTTSPPVHQVPERKQTSSAPSLTLQEAHETWQAKPGRRYSGTRQTSPQKVGRQGRYEAEVLEPRWGWRTCDRCGKTIMLGEEMLRWRLDECIETVCLDCVGALE